MFIRVVLLAVGVLIISAPTTNGFGGRRNPPQVQHAPPAEQINKWTACESDDDCELFTLACSNSVRTARHEFVDDWAKWFADVNAHIPNPGCKRSRKPTCVGKDCGTQESVFQGKMEVTTAVCARKRCNTSRVPDQEGRVLGGMTRDCRAGTTLPALCGYTAKVHLGPTDGYAGSSLEPGVTIVAAPVKTAKQRKALRLKSGPRAVFRRMIKDSRYPRTTSDADATFDLSVPAGPTYVCVGMSPENGKGPAGCAEIDVPKTGLGLWAERGAWHHADRFTIRVW